MKTITSDLRLSILSVSLCSAFGALAQTPGVIGSVPDAKIGDKPRAVTASDTGRTFMDSVFSAPGSTGSLNQLSLTPSYELAGIGRRSNVAEATIVTAPTNGVPMRFENGLFTYASVSVGAGSNSNLTGVATNAIATNFVSTQPDIVAEVKNSGDRYTLRYRGNYTQYSASTADNFNHHFFNAAGDNYFDSRNRLGWDVGYISQTDARGSTGAGVNTDTPNHWTAPTARAIYIYGANQAQGRIELEGNIISKRYDNNRNVTTTFDADITTASGRFFYRVMPKTSAVFELRNTKTSYVSNPGYTNNEVKALVGANWDAAAQTSGSFKLGTAQKTFIDSQLANASGNSWEGAVRWSPLTYSTVDLITNKSFADSTGVGSYLVNTGNNATWTHKWTGSFFTRATAGLLRTEFINDANGRIDDVNSLGFGGFYDLRTNVRLGAEYISTKRKSTNSIYEFNRDTLYLSAQLSL